MLSRGLKARCNYQHVLEPNMDAFPSYDDSVCEKKMSWTDRLWWSWCLSIALLLLIVSFVLCFVLTLGSRAGAESFKYMTSPPTKNTSPACLG